MYRGKYYIQLIWSYSVCSISRETSNFLYHPLRINDHHNVREYQLVKIYEIWSLSNWGIIDRMHRFTDREWCWMIRTYTLVHVYLSEYISSYYLQNFWISPHAIILKYRKCHDITCLVSCTLALWKFDNLKTIFKMLITLYLAGCFHFWLCHVKVIFLYFILP